MQLTATCTLSVTSAAGCPIVAMLRPRNGQAQQVLQESYGLQPWVASADYIDSYGNLCQRLVLPPGSTQIAVAATVEVDADIAVAPEAGATALQELPDYALLYLLQSRYCPSDKMAERALGIVNGAPPGYAQVEQIRAWIHDNLEYQYGVSTATTDALDTLAHGAGVCRDFAHVGIALCRSLRIPARIVVGYLHGLEPMDLHAWFEAFVGDRWYTFDATQDAPRGGRIVLAYGRDAADVAFISDYGDTPLEVSDMQVSVSASSV
ncbi:transglutaminase-like putative cysteine protease [Rhodoferax ferrireducens]|uniref:Transglutaminase-like putative cysteine protease n=1 Tax=Rhodoferax ferrireducens TaxID=192843 RepID=A0ABU2CC91_9BURK|nr:transglutaminase family protein [Rhodoferax ferrireducens]MDR7378936.1 transglutaminase-like putative cysteine protease [Rhodoferax ferrireducens]